MAGVIEWNAAQHDLGITHGKTCIYGSKGRRAVSGPGPGMLTTGPTGMCEANGAVFSGVQFAPCINPFPHPAMIIRIKVQHPARIMNHDVVHAHDIVAIIVGAAADTYQRHVVPNAPSPTNDDQPFVEKPVQHFFWIAICRNT